ncbi:uncharacterized protein LOC132745286 [Ruditapes philippinarum]|uniref:uncharacterized protein LOC132745286 n=1 Tax=Ruditapes philippinarum TaxID=129788 RepID=UPI00295B1F11|nr:uncharacterized protein LOC132745286 [Ruditapes philippinarum]
MAMNRTNRHLSSSETRDPRRQPGTTSSEHQKQNSVQLDQRNFMSHTEFPDVRYAAKIRNQNRSGNSVINCGGMQEQSMKKIAKFKPFDPNTAPANFKNCNKTLNVLNVRQQQEQQQQQEHQQQLNNQNFIEGQQFYNGQGQHIYQYIPPQEFTYSTLPCRNIYSGNMTQSGPSATAVAPNGEKIYIPLDNTKYEIKRNDHDLYDMPENCDLHILPSEGHFESSVQLHSPRPICVRGSLSDEWSCSSNDGPNSDTDSERETDPDTGTDSSEIASYLVSDVLKTITENVNNFSLQTNKDDLNAIEAVSIEQPAKDVLLKKQHPGNSGIEKSPVKKPQTNIIHTDFKNLDSSSSESGKPVTSKRAKVETKSKRFDMKTKKPSQFKEETKDNGKPKDKKSRAWKENRKEKRDKTVNSSKKGRKTELANDVSEVKQETPFSLDAHVLSNCAATEETGNNILPVEAEHIIIDGQYYFQSQYYSGPQYQHCYNPDSVHQECYQQYEYSATPEYTMFIHDACPPPSKDEAFGEVHKSLSGEVINHQAAAYGQQTLGPGLCQQPNMGQVTQMYNNAYQVNAEQINASQVNAEQINCNAEGLVGLNQFSNYGAMNGSSQDFWVTDQAQSTAYSYINSCNVTDPNDEQSKGQGQLFISYDEDSVYVDPESGLSFPALHMTDDFLVTVILREGVFLEITADKVLRLVNHEKKLVVAINETGNKSCIIHPAARIYQSDSNVHTDLYLGRRAKMTEEMIMFGNKLKTYKFDHRMVTEMTEEPVFRDMSHDDSVTFLSTNDATGYDEIKLKMEEILAHAHFWKNGECGSTTVINGTKIVQNEKGDVSVYCGPINFLRMNPEKMILRLKTRFIEVDIETNWNVKITRGSHALNASHMGFIVSNGKVKASLDSDNRLQSFTMPDHRFLMLGQPVSQHRPGVPGGQRRRTPNDNTEPEGDHWGYTRHSTYDDQRCFREWGERIY